VVETYELSPDGRKAIAYFRTLEMAIEQAQAMLSTRPDVGEFDRPRPPARGHVNRDKGYRPAD